MHLYQSHRGYLYLIHHTLFHSSPSTHSFTSFFHRTRNFTINVRLLTKVSFHLMKENALQFMVDPTQSNNFLDRTHAVVYKHNRLKKKGKSSVKTQLIFFSISNDNMLGIKSAHHQAFLRAR